VLFREGLAWLLAERGFVVTGQVGDADALLAAVEQDPPDVTVTDIRMRPTGSSRTSPSSPMRSAGSPAAGR
jgi:DNA-binding NarL/FixJ family response regulator